MLTVEVPHKQYAAGGFVAHAEPIPIDNSYIIPRTSVFHPVSKPQHYSQGMPEGIEVIDIIRAQKGSWELSNAIKYLLRAQFKGNYIQDLEKCVQYLTWEIERNGDPEWNDGTDD